MPEYDHLFLDSNAAGPLKRLPAPRGNKKSTVPDRTQHVQSLQEQTAALFDQQLSSESRIALELELQPEYSARKSEVRTSLERLGLELGHIEDERHVFVWTTSETRERLEQKLAIYAKGTDQQKRTFAPISKIQRWPQSKRIAPSLASKLSENTESVLDVTFRLANYAPADVLTKAIKAIRVADPTARYTQTEGMHVVQALLASKQIQELLSEEDAIARVEVPVRYRPILLGQAIGAYEPRMITPPNANAPSVCILDTGIDTHPYLRGVIEAADHANYLPHGEDENGHGTFVAGLIAYGDDVRTALRRPLLKPALRVFSVKVFGDSLPHPGADQLLEAIRAAVNTFKSRTRVFNLSFQGDQPYRRDGATSAVTPLAAGLDRIARDADVLFVVASGNVSPTLLERFGAEFPLTHLSPLCGICSPSEAVNVLSVGATIPIMVEAGIQGLIGMVDGPSPCSTIGPGVDDAPKPELIAPGGGYCERNYQVLSPQESSIFSLLPMSKGGVGYGVGTSYAAPLVARLAAKIVERYPFANANLIRAILLHTAQPYIPALLHDEHEPLWARLSGFGHTNERIALASASHRVCYLFQGQIEADRQQEIEFYVPDAFLHVANFAPGYALRMTLVYDPPIYPESAEFYCKLSVSASLHVPSGRTRTWLSPERRSGKEFHNVKTYGYSIPKSACANTCWKVRVVCKARTGFTLKDAERQQRYALVIELLDATACRPLYGICAAHYLRQAA